MSAAKEQALISAEEYLNAELKNDRKHELIYGQIYAMAGASANHERIAGNIYRQFGNHLEHLPCEPFASDMKVKANANFFYPDVIVDCEFDESQPYYTETPIIIIEVLSKSTCQKDRTIKRFAYLNIPSLQEYVLVEQDFVDIEVVSRKNDWSSKHYFLGDHVTFEPIGLSLSVAQIYHRVQNDDMLVFNKS